jgi:uncharacterized protein
MKLLPMKPHTMNLKTIATLTKFVVIAFLLFVNSSIATAQDLTQEEDALLWKVSGKEITKPSYLFGTIHLYCTKDEVDNPTINKTIQETDLVAMELNLNDIKVLMTMFKMAMEKPERPLNEVLTAEQLKIVDQTCRQILKDSIENLLNKSPQNLMTTIMMSPSFVGCYALPIDFFIADLSKKYQIKSMGLETIGFQDSLLKSVPDSVQNKWLMDLCQNPNKAQAELKEMLSIYAKQNGKALYDYALKVSPEMNFFQNELLDQRNIKWVEYLSPQFQQTSFFVAVGAGHLGGNKGLINLLRQQGYTLTPIRY